MISPLVLGLGYSLTGLTLLHPTTPPKYTLYFIITSILIPPASLLIYKTCKPWFWQLNTYKRYIIPTPIEAMEYILKRSKQDYKQVVKYFDEFCWRVPMMNLGDVKGKICDLGVMGAMGSAKGEFKMLELGAFCTEGIDYRYSTIRFAGLMKDNPGTFTSMKIYSVDPDGLASSVAAKLIWHAGLTDYVEPFFGYSDEAIHKYLEDKIKFDCVFLDHAKSRYLPDLKKLLEYGLLNPNCVVIADNIVFPGVPDYKQFMLKGDGKQLFDTVAHDTSASYSKSRKDQVLISVYRG